MSASYDQAVSQATKAFLRVMDLHGFAPKGDRADVVRHFYQATEYSFHAMTGGPDEHCDLLVEAMLNVSQEPRRSRIINEVTSQG